jgi:hypothetical protein
MYGSSWIAPEEREIVEVEANDLQQNKDWAVGLHVIEYTSDVDWLPK